MHKLFWTDSVLTIITILGSYYLYISGTVSALYAFLLFTIYLSSKIVGYFILPYSKFETFIIHLTNESKLSILSGFEIFKTTLVVLLFIGFIFIDPAIWIIESILVIVMRVWGVSFINKYNK